MEATDEEGRVVPDICAKCGKHVQVGDWPWCPHERGTYTEIGDEWPGGGPRTFENMGAEPVTCDTKSDYRRELKARGLQEFVRWAGPGDQHVQRWACMDPYTLRSAEALVARVAREGQAHDAEPDERLESLTLEVTNVEVGP